MVKRTRAQGPNIAANPPPSKIIKLLDSQALDANVDGEADPVAKAKPGVDDTEISVSIDTSSNSSLRASSIAADDSSSSVGSSEAAPTVDAIIDSQTTPLVNTGDASPVTSDHAVANLPLVNVSPDRIFAEVIGPNPFATLFPTIKRILPGVLTVTIFRQIDGTADAQDVCTINILEAHRPTNAQRLLNWASHSDNTSIKSPKGGIMNVALADPGALSFHEGTGYLWSKTSRSWVVSSLLGQTEYYSNEQGKIRQISTTPFTQGWHRFAAVLGSVCGETALYFQSWMGGVTFGTNRYPSNGLVVAGHRDKANCAPIEGSILGNGKTIPVYDGRTRFQLGKYWECPYTGEVAKGSTVMLLFTIKKGTLPNRAKEAGGMPVEVKVALYLNVVGVIVLAEPTDTFSEVSSEGSPNDAGVDEIKALPESSEAGTEVMGPDPVM